MYEYDVCTAAGQGRVSQERRRREVRVSMALGARLRSFAVGLAWLRWTLSGVWIGGYQGVEEPWYLGLID